MKHIRSALIAVLVFLASAGQAQNVARFVDPRIGSEGVGRVFIGPSCPYGMVKPSPSCTSSNSGWLPMPERVNGFAQVHVSGTGGGPKYGNVLVQPFCGAWDTNDKSQLRTEESIALGYYSSVYADGIKTEVTTAERSSLYRFTFPAANRDNSLLIDAGFFLGEPSQLFAREAQQFVGAQVQVVSDHEVCGYTRIRGGWNNGRAYTVYFHLTTDEPFVESKTWNASTKVQPAASFSLSDSQLQIDRGRKTGAFLRFDRQTVKAKIGISFVSEARAKENAEAASWSLEDTRQALIGKWEDILGRVQLSDDTPDCICRMFYTGLYHTMLMPVCRTGENHMWNDDEGRTPYYDDFYAIWDTYRTSTPLITLLDPEREVEMVQSLIDIYRHDGYMPDARSGNANGRTQGGSNAEVVIADAWSKGLEGIDYEAALEAMLKDATVPPGGNEEAEGRGGLMPYLQKGYIPYGTPRAGNRTVEYSLCDYAIAQVAKGLGHDALYEQYMRQSGNWKNLWRADAEQDGVKGFIMPRAEDGRWMDSVPFGHSTTRRLRFRYTPDTSYEGPWYLPWWDCFMYEASSWEYSLSIPHDVPGLVALCGGREAFVRRLDTFFDCGHYNVGNEPSFLTPCLYHWAGLPNRSADRVRDIVARHFNNSPLGLPGNDDSGAMSSWLGFHLMGLYPLAGTNLYLVHSPFVRETKIKTAAGTTFTIKAKNFSAKNTHVRQLRLNGEPLDSFFITHQQILDGGVLEMEMMKGGPIKQASEAKPVPSLFAREKGDYLLTFSLHGQTRKYEIYLEGNDLHWRIMRHGRWETGVYRISDAALNHGTMLCYERPKDGQTVRTDELFGIVSQDIIDSLSHDRPFCLDGMTFIPDAEANRQGEWRVRYAHSKKHGASIGIIVPEGVIYEMKNNPAEINWKTSPL